VFVRLSHLVDKSEKNNKHIKYIRNVLQNNSNEELFIV